MPYIDRLVSDVIDSTSATLTDTGLVIPLAAGHLVRFEFYVLYKTDATTTGIAFALDTPGSDTWFEASARVPLSTAVGASNYEVDATVTDAEQMTFSASPSVSGSQALIVGSIQPSLPGQIKLQFNTEVNGSLATVKKGSYGYFKDLGLL